MKKKEFAAKVQAEISERLGSDYKVSVKEVEALAGGNASGRVQR